MSESIQIVERWTWEGTPKPGETFVRKESNYPIVKITSLRIRNSMKRYGYACHEVERRVGWMLIAAPFS